jgi:hypothetical protein
MTLRRTDKMTLKKRINMPRHPILLSHYVGCHSAQCCSAEGRSNVMLPPVRASNSFFTHDCFQTMKTTDIFILTPACIAKNN